MRQPKLVVAVFFATALLFARASQAATFSFQPLGDLTGGAFFSSASGISGDGLVVVGSSKSTNSAAIPAATEAFRWVGGVMTGLGDLPLSTFNSSSAAAAGNGGVVVGNGTGTSGTEAFRWDGSIAGLAGLPGGDNSSRAFKVSGDGTIIVGTSKSAASGVNTEAFRWTSGTGMQPLGDLPLGAFGSTARGISSDGLVIVGQGQSINGQEAFSWTSGGLFVPLGDLAGGSFQSLATAANSDGSVIVGQGLSGSGLEAFRWTSGPGMVGLGDLALGSFSSMANDVSADGSVVVGFGTTAVGTEAFVWTQATGMLNLRSVLIAAGFSFMSNWSLTSATGISADGTTIVGSGINPDGNNEGWIATIGPTLQVPEPTSIVLAGFAGLGLAFAAMRRRAD